ncbi:MAG: GNAT family N-acetyltransferase [Proteobacteria bacterium]|nr:GNAT family N-acetyltransferase [Pseudomonadota bacterium]
MALRYLELSDYATVSTVVDDWWGGRPMRGMLPRLFFEHFRPTSFVLEEDRRLRGFLIGFRSQTDPAVAYIHFVGIDPDNRGLGYGRMLYEHFFGVACDLGCSEVHCITSPVNLGSIQFHRHMGFQIDAGNGIVDGVPVCLDHGGPGQHRVLFRKSLTR